MKTMKLSVKSLLNMSGSFGEDSEALCVGTVVRIETVARGSRDGKLGLCEVARVKAAERKTTERKTVLYRGVLTVTIATTLEIFGPSSSINYYKIVVVQNVWVTVMISSSQHR